MRVTSSGSRKIHLLKTRCAMKFTEEQDIVDIGNFCGGKVAAADVRRKFYLKYEISGRAK